MRKLLRRFRRWRNARRRYRTRLRIIQQVIAEAYYEAWSTGLGDDARLTQEQAFNLCQSIDQEIEDGRVHEEQADAE